MFKLSLAAVLLLSLGLNLASIDYAQPRHYDQAVDALPPLFCLDAMANVTGERTPHGLKYPRLHYLVAGAAQRLYLRTHYGAAEGARLEHELLDRLANRPPVRASYRDLGDVIGRLIVVARVVSAVMGVLLVLGLFLLVREVLGALEGLIAAALAAVSYPVVYYAHTANVDVPYLAWGIFALWCGARAVRSGRAGWLVAAAALAALAMATKDQAYGWFLLTAPVLLYLFVRPGPLGEGQVRRVPAGALAVALGLSLGVWLLALGLPFDMAGFRAHFDHIFHEGVEPFREHPRNFIGHWLLLGETLLHLHDTLGRELLIAALLGSVYLLGARPQAAALLLVPAVSYYATFIAPIGYVYLRFTLPLLLPLLAAAAALSGALLRTRWVRYAAAPALLALFALRARLAVELDVMLPADPRVAAERYLEQELPKGSRVAASIALQNHNLEFPPELQVRHHDVGTTHPGYGDDPPEYLVTSFFDPARKIVDAERTVRYEPEALPPQAVIRQFAREYDLVTQFVPKYDHPLRAGAAFQPTVQVYRLRPLPAAAGPP